MAILLRSHLSFRRRHSGRDASVWFTHCPGSAHLELGRAQRERKLVDAPAQLSLRAAEDSSDPPAAWWPPDDEAMPAPLEGPGVSITPILTASE